MPKIAEIIELTVEEYEKMNLIQKRMNLSINEFINKAVKEKIQKNEYPIKNLINFQLENLKNKDLISWKWYHKHKIEKKSKL